MQRNETDSETGRSIITDNEGNRFELIPRVSKKELKDIAKAIPGINLNSIAKYSHKSGTDRHYKIIIGSGAHSKARLARQINKDGSRGDYVVVKKIQSSDELHKTHVLTQRARSSSGAMHIRTQMIPLELHRQNSEMEMKRTGQTIRHEVFQSIGRELEVHALLKKKQLDGICLIESTVNSFKKANSEEKQLYQFMPLITFGDLAHLKQLVAGTSLSFKEGKSLKTHISNQMISIVLSLHSTTTVIHRDIKPDNFLLDNKGKILLTDWGCAAYENDAGELLLVSGPTTPSYQAPSYLTLCKQDYREKYRLRDEWALALSLLELWDINLLIADNPLAKIQALNRDMVQASRNIAPANKLLEIQERINSIFNEFKISLKRDMDLKPVPLHIQEFIFAALEVDPSKRKDHIRNMVNVSSLEHIDVSEEVAMISSHIAKQNKAFFRPNPGIVVESEDIEKIEYLTDTDSELADLVTNERTIVGYDKSNTPSPLWRCGSTASSGRLSNSPSSTLFKPEGHASSSTTTTLTMNGTASPASSSTTRRRRSHLGSGARKNNG